MTKNKLIALPWQKSEPNSNHIEYFRSDLNGEVVAEVFYQNDMYGAVLHNIIMDSGRI